MANVPISDLSALPSTDVATGDLLPIVDVSEALDADKTKNITPANLFAAGAVAEWQDWTPTFTGFSTDPTNVTARYCRIGNVCHVAVYMLTPGTSNANTFTVTQPITAAAPGPAYNSLGYYEDGGVDVYGQGYVRALSSGVFSLGNDSGGSGWTTSGDKRAMFTITYEIA